MFLAEHPHAVVADLRWYLDGRDGRSAYEAAHLPGAVFVDLETDLAHHDAPATDGRHPLPAPADFAAAMGRLGIGDDSIVVAYDDTGGVTAGRLVVMLRMLGRDAALLDGGMGTWDGVLQSGPGFVPEPRHFTPQPWPAHLLADPADVADAAAAGQPVLDARAADRFTGEVTMIDPRPGHIPGARNAPWSAVLAPDGRFLDTADLRAHFATLGVDDGSAPIAYCGSGVSACMNILAMEHAGLPPARLYVASWSGWSADPRREAALGA